MTFSRILREFARRLKTINPWHFVWIIFLSAEIMTLLLNVLQSLLRWERISAELIFIGIIDAGVNALIISPLAIYFLRHTARLEEMNRLLEAEISERIDAEKALKKSIEEQKRLEAQLMHAQKMEAVGTLAGGVA
ncbi:MAG TPA: hypothetical protein VK435_09270, partial [Thermodesulfovibrionales bacterium]|nr:hypothetical protein [Thermodesulfovibrionales bacterium]